MDPAALPQRQRYKVRGTALQELILLMTPGTLYAFFSTFGLHLLVDSKDKQYVYSLLPDFAHERLSLKCVGVAFEVWLMLFWASAAHFGILQSITMVRTVQTLLLQSSESLV